MTNADARVDDEGASVNVNFMLFDEDSTKVIWVIEECCEDWRPSYSVRKSQRFSTGPMKENTWYLEFHSSRFNLRESNISLELHLEDSKAFPVKVEVECNIVNPSQKKFCEVEQLGSTLNSKGGMIPLISTTLSEIKNACKISGGDYILQIWCRIRHTDDCITALAHNLNQMRLYEHCLSKDLKLMMEDTELSDVELVVEKQKFQAHKIILASRSPVFKAMFRNDMQEKISNIVNIPDVSFNVMKKLLSYIYTDRVELMEDSVGDVLAAAEKYQILGLKSICSKFIMMKLNEGNVIKSLILAEHYHARDLREESIDFIVKNMKRLPRMKGLDAFIISHPSLLKHILLRVSISLW